MIISGHEEGNTRLNIAISGIFILFGNLAFAHAVAGQKHAGTGTLCSCYYFP